MKRLILILSACLPLLASAQIGGRHVYDFLNLSPSARQAALGGVNVSTYDHDALFSYANPALANDSMHQQASFAIANYLSDITYGYAGYAHSVQDIGTFHAGMQYLTYGKMTEADIYGNQLGQFSASDLALVMGGAHKRGLFSLGGNLKIINSNIQRYRSHWAMAFDLGGAYVSEKGNFTAGMVFKNIGFNLTPWDVSPGQRTTLPFEIQLGVSHKLEHMPLRFSLTTVNVETPNLIYFDKDAPPEIDLSGDTIVKKFPIADNLFRHLVFGGEFLISKGFNIRAGYNHMRRQELRSLNRGGLSGFSFGAGIKIKWFRLDYALSSFHAVGPTHHFMLSTNIGSFAKK